MPWMPVCPSFCLLLARVILLKIQDAHVEAFIGYPELPNEVPIQGLSATLFLMTLKSNPDYCQSLRAFRLLKLLLLLFGLLVSSVLHVFGFSTELYWHLFLETLLSPQSVFCAFILCSLRTLNVFLPAHLSHWCAIIDLSWLSSVIYSTSMRADTWCMHIYPPIDGRVGEHCKHSVSE